MPWNRLLVPQPRSPYSTSVTLKSAQDKIARDTTSGGATADHDHTRTCLTAASISMRPTRRRDAEFAPLLLRPGVNQPVGRDSDKGDADTGGETETRVDFGQRNQGLLAQIPGADKGGDDEHAQSHHQCLVDAEHDVGQRQRQLDPFENLQVRAAHRPARLDEVTGDLANAVVGIADRRHDGIKRHRDHGGEIADAEQHDDGDQVDEGRAVSAAYR